MENSDNTNYNELVDHLVTTMKSQSQPPFDTPAYQNYKAQVDKQREELAGDDIIEGLYKLGFKIDQTFDKLIKLCDKILEEDSPPKS
mgnify:CR=1 FL=1|tara:strand:- start:123 stop:383 length:261 start_codon:yes stop_codon:yes gene_type:complete